MPRWTFKRLPASTAAVLVPFIVSLLMSGLISFVATLKNLGFVDGLFAIWFGAWVTSWLIAFPSLLVLLPLARRFVARLVEPGR